jgi:hypothetical protein
MSRATQIKKAIEEKLLIHGIYQRVFDNEDGRAVLRHLMRNGFVMDSTFVPGDPHKTALNEGSRRIVLSIFRYVNKTPRDVAMEIEQAYKEQ